MKGTKGLSTNWSLNSRLKIAFVMQYVVLWCLLFKLSLFQDNFNNEETCNNSVKDDIRMEIDQNQQEQINEISNENLSMYTAIPLEVSLFS